MKNKILILLTIFSFFSCETKSIQSNSPSDINSTTELGSKFTSIEKNIGKPNEINIEKYGSNSFKVLEYYDKNQRPLKFYTVDQKDIVISKSTWVQPEQKSSDLSWLLKNEFPNLNFKNYVPCETSGDQKFLVDEDRGIFIGHHEQKVVLISQSSPELTKMRINQFKTICPQLQEW